MTVSDWGPDSPADDAPDLGGSWEARFVGDPGTVRPISAAPGEHFPPAELDGYRLSSANEATRVATYRRADDQEVADLPPSVAAPGRTPVPADTEERDGRTALRDDLALVLVEADGFEQPAHMHYVQAVAVLEAGYRLVSEDEATVERVAEIRALEKTLAYSRQIAADARSEGLDQETCRFWSGVNGFLRSRIRALEAGEEPDWPDAANSARTDLDDEAVAVRALREAGQS